MRDNIKTHFYPLPCGFAVSVSNNSLYRDTIHLCGVGEYAVIYQIEKRIPSFARNFLHDNSLFPSTLHFREDQFFDPLQFGNKVFFRDHISNPRASLEDIFSSELQLPLTVPTYFNWKMNPRNFSDQQIIYGAMLSYGAMKMHQKIFARFFFLKINIIIFLFVYDCFCFY
jgi:hypothetical protein